MGVVVGRRGCDSELASRRQNEGFLISAARCLERFGGICWCAVRLPDGGKTIDFHSRKVVIWKILGI